MQVLEKPSPSFAPSLHSFARSFVVREAIHFSPFRRFTRTDRPTPSFDHELYRRNQCSRYRARREPRSGPPHLGHQEQRRFDQRHSCPRRASRRGVSPGSAIARSECHRQRRASRPHWRCPPPPATFNVRRVSVRISRYPNNEAY